ncbi:VWA domain-containing protein [bacterium]|nr:VWA domain-containing protein [bacterium]
MKKALILLLAIFSTTLAFPLPEAQAGEFKVYSPRAYRQLQKLQEPIKVRTNSYTQTQLLVDYSGSMKNWIKVAIETLEIVLPNVTRKNIVGLRTFGGRNNGGNYQTACQMSNLVTGFSRRNDEAILTGLKDSRVGGLTPIEFALHKTVDEDFAPANIFDKKEDAKKSKKIILVTDGHDTCGGDPCAYIRELMSERNDISIDVIQLGSGTHLACLAEESGGTFYQVNNNREIFEMAFEQSFELPEGSIQISKTIENESTYKEKTPHYNQDKPLARKYKYVGN